MNDRGNRRRLAGLLVAIGVLTAAIRGGPGLHLSRDVHAVDRAARDASQLDRTHGGDAFAGVLRRWGEPAAYVPIVCGFLLIGWLRSDRRMLRRARRMAGTLALAGMLCWALKLSIGRERPRWSTDPAVFHSFTKADSYPSGHATVAVALSASLAEGLVSPIGTAALYALAAGTAWSRVNDNRHWFTDVLAGALVGMLAALFVRRRRRWPRTAEPPDRHDAVAAPSEPRQPD